MYLECTFTICVYMKCLLCIHMAHIIHCTHSLYAVLNFMFCGCSHLICVFYHNKCWVVVVCSRTANPHNDLCMTVSIVSVCIYVGVVISGICASVQIELCVVCNMIFN